MENSQSTILIFSNAKKPIESSGTHQNKFECCKCNPSVVLDFADVGETDLKLVQLIESADISAEQEGKSRSRSASASSALRAVLERGGFLGDPADPRTQFWLAGRGL